VADPIVNIFLIIRTPVRAVIAPRRKGRLRNDIFSSKGSLGKMISKKTTIFVLLISALFIISRPSLSDQSVRRVWAWHLDGYEIYDMTFSNMSDQIAFVKKFHVPDGIEAEAFTKEQLKEFQLMGEKNNRFSDPELTLMNIGKAQADRIDWGWQPCFSPDGKKLAYSHQKNPMSLYRDSAVARRGNEVFEYDLVDKDTRTLVMPGMDGYLSEPLYSPDGQEVLYYSSTGVNGTYGRGNVGAGRLSLKTMKAEILLQPQREFGLWCLVKDKLYLDNKIMAIRARPASSGTFLADWYIWELMDLTRGPVVVHEWGKFRLFADPDVGVMKDSAGNILVYDQRWGLLSQHGDSAAPASALGTAFGITSPDGRYFIEKPVKPRILYRHEGIVRVGDYLNPSFSATWKYDGELQDMKWLPDSKKIALVITAYKDKDQVFFAHDEIIILEVIKD